MVGVHLIGVHLKKVSLYLFIHVDYFLVINLFFSFLISNSSYFLIY